MPYFISNVRRRKIVNQAEYVIGDFLFILLLHILHLHNVRTIPIDDMWSHILLISSRVYLVRPYIEILLYCLEVKGLDNCVVLLR